MRQVSFIIEYGIPSGPGAESLHEFKVFKRSLIVIGWFILFRLISSTGGMLRKKLSIEPALHFLLSPFS